MIERPASPAPPVTPEVKAGICLATIFVVVGWAVPAAALWLQAGKALPLGPALAGTFELVGQQRWADPAAAYPKPWSQLMPDPTGWWAAAAWAALTLGLFALGIWRRLDALAVSNVVDRTGGIRGSRPRSWARRDDLRALHIKRAEPGRFTLGRLDDQLLASDDEAHVALVAPTRSGKTTRYVIPWLLEHQGPAVVTSTKTDVLHATQQYRAKHGTVSVWNPFAAGSVCWTPLTGCEDWQTALAQAQWLADAAQEGDSEIATYWRGEAARLLAPLLHAAALGQGGIEHVLEWLDSQNTAHPAGNLKDKTPAAYRQLTGISELDSRNRGTIYMSAGSLLAAYRIPAVQATATDGFTPQAFLNGEPNTLYLIASARQQRLLAPLLVAILSGVLNHAAHQAATRPLKPTLRLLLDETANIAPLRDLPAHLSQAAGHGVRIATVWQSLAQAQHRYGRAFEDILANSTAKLYLGPVTDATTREHITGLLGEERIDTATLTADVHRRSQTASRTHRPKATAGALQQLDVDRALLIEGRHPPALIDTAPWWQQRKLRRRGSR